MNGEGIELPPRALLHALRFSHMRHDYVILPRHALGLGHAPHPGPWHHTSNQAQIRMALSEFLSTQSPSRITDFIEQTGFHTVSSHEASSQRLLYEISNGGLVVLYRSFPVMSALPCHKEWSQPSAPVAGDETPTPDTETETPVASQPEAEPAPTFTPAQREDDAVPESDPLLIRAYWSPLEAMCGDPVVLVGEGERLSGGQGAGSAASDGEHIVNLEQTSMARDTEFELSWTVADVLAAPIDHSRDRQVNGEASISGQTATTDAALVVKTLEHPNQEQVKWALRSGIYGWNASFRFSIAGDELTVHQTLHLHKAWVGKSLLFDATLDKRSDRVWAKRSGANWVFWDTTVRPNSWAAMPRPIASYTLVSTVFVEKNGIYVARSGNGTWPEAFVDPPNFKAKTKAWLANIQSVWDDKFVLKRKACSSVDDACCRWKVRVAVDWSSTTGDKKVYAIWAQDWERSNAQDWYLTEKRAGVAAHECGHLLGAYDEYTGGALDSPAVIANNSIMGQKLTISHARHLKELAEQITKKLPQASSRCWSMEVKSK